MTENSAVHHTVHCRLCGEDDLRLIIPYPATPIADAYVTAPYHDDTQELYPLDLYRCNSCGHVQLCDVIAPGILFSSYTYETSVSLGLLEHFRQYANEVMEYVTPSPGALVVEIGSNDGLLLRFFRERGLRVVGVDPARAIAAKATVNGIETIPEFFTRECACQIKKRYGKADIVAANNVFAHADNLGDIADGIAELLGQNGVFCFEVSYLPDILDKKLFDTVYHEHLCYHSVTPLQGFFRLHKLELIDFIPVSTKGGSFRGIVRRIDGSQPVSPSVIQQIAYEKSRGFDTEEPFRRFAMELASIKNELVNLLKKLRGQGCSIVGYGASATVTTLIYYFGLGEFIEYLVDDNSGKHNTFSPGLHLPVFQSELLYKKRPDIVVILAWIYALPILKRHEAFIEGGGRFIIPLPTVKVVYSLDGI